MQQNEERFGRAVQILATWLERGDCSKRNANGFYSMIQSAHAHLRRLGSEKSQLEEEARRTHDTLRQKFLHLTSQRKKDLALRLDIGLQFAHTLGL